MKTTSLIFRIFFISVIVLFSSCSEDDSKNDEIAICQETVVTMIVNGETQTFYAYGRGIGIRSDGYELIINVGRNVQNPLGEQDIAIYLPYKATGKNIIEQFIYSQYKDNIIFRGDFLDGELQSNVLVNTKSCFRMTFSGKLSDGNQEIVITEGKISYMYDESFSE
ncbi:hypothetical protein Aeqsu_0066 [Aequorivita sublithincola DSM 14238]|uniref:Lipoprotein n=1 Tax=Aequorivita sublithincola (strain DSM 14238 / LMG 21431 / ACAM 643 / 9-3) TaxID=746697 RepID=I3YRI0_AEQSU|nr:hypothetical protein [Aequorivita sublithincola]AFL79598.1 hypothetical protein Aeqsu_0066 [Aequorivita sublithincola DSM 14238]